MLVLHPSCLPTLSPTATCVFLLPDRAETLPNHVKAHMISLLRDFLDRNLEDA